MAIKERIKFYKKSAIELLRKRIITVILATLVLIAVCIGTLSIIMMIAQFVGGLFSQTVADNLMTGATFIWLLFIMPVLHGYLFFMMKCSQDLPCEIGDIFSGFRSIGELSHAFNANTFYILWLIITSVLCMLTYELGRFCFRTVLYTLFAASEETVAGLAIVETIICSAVMLPVIYLCLLALARLHMALCLYTANESERYDSLIMCYKLAKPLAKGKKHEYLLLNLSFIGWYILSFFTAGILFVCFTLPFHILTLLEFFRYANLSHSISDDTVSKHGDTDMN